MGDRFMDSRKIRLVLIGLTVAAAASPAMAERVRWASRVNTQFGAGQIDQTKLDLKVNGGGSTFVFDSAGGAGDPAGRSFTAAGSADLGLGEMRLNLIGSGGPGLGFDNAIWIVNAMLIETFQFEGTFSGQSVPFSLSLDGFWGNSGDPLQSANSRTQLFIMDGDVVIDASTLASAQTINNDIFFNPAITPRVSDLRQLDYRVPGPLVSSGSVVLNGVNPRIQVVFGTTLVARSNSANTAFFGDFTNTAYASADFGGLTVYSESGTFPGTLPIPAPGALAALGAAGLLARRRR